MNWHFTPYALPLFVGALMLGVVAVLSWQRRSTWEAMYMLATSITLSFYVLGYAFELGQTTLDGVIFWAKVEYIGITLSPVMLFLLILAYTGKQRFLTDINRILLLVIPVLTIIFAWTNEQHEWIWQAAKLVPMESFYVIDFQPGGWYWVNVAYIWSMMVLGLLFLVQTYMRVSGLYRRQIGILLVGMLIPLATHLVYLSGLAPVKIDWSPYAFVLTAIIAFWGMSNFQLLDITPVARDKVFASMDDGVIVLDDRDRMIDFNPAIERIIEKPGLELVGQPVSQVFPDYQDLIGSHSQVEEAHTEIALGEGDAQRYYDLRVSLLSGRKNRTVGRLIVFREITGRRRAEEEREQLIRELDAFAQTVAHDLKNPLMVLGSYSILLLEEYADLSPEHIEEYLQIIANTSRKMGNIINELLLLAGMRKMDEIKIIPLNMSQIVDEARQRLFTMITECGATLVEPDEWPLAMGYGPWIEEVWANYISNAIKYGGSPPLLELGATEQPDGMVRFWLRDNGAGIAPEDLPRLFTQFTRLDALHVQGHGLGLSIVKHIVEKLNGQVGAKSVVGQGSTFSFTLPATDARQEPPT
ncbi:MAG: PAS domain-containing protein [Anaerolineae bacterium]|nr:PAS domain-containing protein [Anaerolineae bacterium]